MISVVKSFRSLYTLLMRAQIRQAGHIVCMPDESTPKQLLYGKLSKGKHSVGARGSTSRTH